MSDGVNQEYVFKLWLVIVTLILITGTWGMIRLILD